MKMEKEIVKKEDGRQLIYYTFTDCDIDTETIEKKIKADNKSENKIDN